MLKSKNFVLTVILPLFLSLIAGTVIVILNNTSILHTRATATVESEKIKMNNEITALKKEKESLTYAAAEYNKQIEDNEAILKEISELTTELDELNSKLETLPEEIEALQTEIESKSDYNEGLSSITPTQPGTAQAYTDKTLNIPSDLKSGRYTAEGTGTLFIYTIAGTLQDKKDLSLLDTHTYTFDITSGQSIKIEGTLSLIEIVQQ